MSQFDINDLERWDLDEASELVRLPPSNVNQQQDVEELDDDFFDLFDVPENLVCEIEVFNDEYINEVSESADLKIRSHWTQVSPVFENFENIQQQTNETYFEQQNLRIEENVAGKTPLEVFSLFLEDKFLEEIVTKSVNYALEKTGEPFEFSVGCLRRFVGIMFYSGYRQVPEEKMYWSMDSFEGVDLVKQTMSRNRFWNIKRFIRFDDQKPNPADRSWQISPFINYINQRFMMFGCFAECLTIDQILVSHNSGQSNERVLNGKRIRSGFKLWLLCDSKSGYCVSFKYYEGGRADPELGLGEEVVLNFVEDICQPEHHKFYFDDSFTSFKLMYLLKHKNIRATGAVLPNRTNKCPISEVFSKKNCPKNTHESHFDEINQILCTVWKDSQLVKLLTNHEPVEPFQIAKRNQTTVRMPSNVLNYVKNIRAVERLEDKVDLYRICIRSKKWYWSLFTQSLNMAMVNAYKLHSMVNKTQEMSFFQFYKEVTLGLLQTPSLISQPQPRRARVQIQENEFDYLDFQGHYLEKIPDGKQLRCRQCKSNSRFRCHACVVGVHVECFPSLHHQT